MLWCRQTDCLTVPPSLQAVARLPNVRELESLVHLGVFDPALPNTAGTGKWTEGDPFSGVQALSYWSSTTIAATTGQAWGVFMVDGGVSLGWKTVNAGVWPVRDGQ
jgi:hypothetical protein